MSLLAISRLVLCLVLLLSPLVGTSTGKADELPLAFNGKDFTGWRVPEGNRWWKIDQGVLRGENGPHRKGSDLWTEKEYKNFVMQLDFKMVSGNVDSGVYIRDSSQQIQIGNSSSLKRDLTCSPYIIGNGYPQEAEGVGELLKPKDWNTMTILAVGDCYTVSLNGTQVLSYRSKTAVEKGPIGFQVHPGNVMKVEFRNIRLAELK